MSLGLIPIFLGKTAAKFRALGEVLAHELDALEQVAAKAGIVPLSAFTDQRQIPVDFDGDPEELEDILGPCTDWFDAATGADAVGHLIRAIERDESSSVPFVDRTAVLEELALLKSCLQTAAAGHTKFRLELV